MTRRQDSTAFKSKVALAAIAGQETIASIASRFNVHPGQVQAWKAAALKNFPSLFERSAKVSDHSQEQCAALERKAGQLAMENDFLKKNWQGYLRKQGKI